MSIFSENSFEKLGIWSENCEFWKGRNFEVRISNFERIPNLKWEFRILKSWNFEIPEFFYKFHDFLKFSQILRIFGFFWIFKKKIGDFWRFLQIFGYIPHSSQLVTVLKLQITIYTTGLISPRYLRTARKVR